MSLPTSITRTSIELYRDCLRLVRHVAPGSSSPKGKALRQSVRQQFKARQCETNPDLIDAYKLDAVRALSNYMLVTSAPKDPKFAVAMKDFHKRSIPAKQQKDATEQRTQPTTTNNNNDNPTTTTNQQ